MSPINFDMCHPEFAVLTVSWELALRADGYADNTVKAYQNAVRRLAADGVDAMLKRRGLEADIADLHPHALRHAWAHAVSRSLTRDTRLPRSWRKRGRPDAPGRLAQPGHVGPMWQDSCR